MAVTQNTNTVTMLKSRSSLIRVFSYILENSNCRYTDIKKALDFTDTTLSKTLNILINKEAIVKKDDSYIATINMSGDADRIDYYLSKLLFYMKRNTIDNEYLNDNLMLMMEYLLYKK